MAEIWWTEEAVKWLQNIYDYISGADPEVSPQICRRMAGVSRRPPAYANRCVARKRAPTEHPGANRRRSPLAGDLTGENSSAETRNQLAGRKPVSLCPAWREYGDASGADPIAAKNVIEGIYEKSQILERFAEIGYNTAMNQMGM